jgi:TRAP-type C4-dicarboxylate transport system substrate-binding protein
MLGCLFFNSALQVQAKPIELSFNMLEPDRGQLVKNMHRPWAAGVEKVTEGRVKIVFYWSGGLGHPLKNFDLVRSGVADMGWAFPSWTPGKFPMTSVLELPFLFENATQAALVSQEMYELHLKEEYKEVHLLTLSNTGPTDIIMSKEPVRKLEDMKGKKIRALGAIPTRIIQNLGAVPVPLSIIDMHEGLERGTIEGSMIGTQPIKTYQLMEVIKYVTDAAIHSQVFYYVMNKKKWMSISEKDRKAIMEISGIKLAKMGGNNFHREDIDTKTNFLKKFNIKVIKLSKEERARWKGKVKPVIDWWIKDMESKGLPGKQLYDEALRLSIKYENETY